MIPLVMTYSYGDGYTYSADMVIPFEYESKEKAENDFFALAYKNKELYLKFCETGEPMPNPVHSVDFFEDDYYNPSTLYFWYFDTSKEKIMKETNIEAWIYAGPQIHTLEEWVFFNKAKVKNNH